MYIVYTFVFMSNKIVSYLILSYLRQISQANCEEEKNCFSERKVERWNYTLITKTSVTLLDSTNPIVGLYIDK